MTPTNWLGVSLIGAVVSGVFLWTARLCGFKEAAKIWVIARL